MWKKLDKNANARLLGYIPDIITELDERPVREQVADRYAHGGGFSPFGVGDWKLNSDTKTIQYPGDPPYKPLFSTQIRDEMVVLYDHSIVAVIQANGKFDVIRMD